MRNRYFYKTNFLLLMLVVFVSGCFSIGHAEPKDEFLETVTNLVVMIEGELNGAPTFGAGIIFNQENDGLSIVTANHVVRRSDQDATDIRVTLKPYPEKRIPAKLIEKFDPELDLAVLELSGLDDHQIDIKKFDMRALDKAVIERNDAVFPVGNPNGVPWGMPVVPDRVAQIVGKSITFQSAFIGAGHSGGGLIGEGGVLIGMIVKDQPPFGQAIQISSIESAITKWGLAFGLHPGISYEIDGMWRAWDHDLFDDQLTIEVDGDNLRGSMRIKYPWITTATMGPIVRKVENHTEAFGGDTVLTGDIKGNEIILRGKGFWELHTISRPEYGEPSRHSSELIKFSIILRGVVFSDEITFKYQFKYPSLGEKSDGAFTAQRG